METNGNDTPHYDSKGDRWLHYTESIASPVSESQANDTMVVSVLVYPGYLLIEQLLVMCSCRDRVIS